ncbi:MAG TPA: hypothetical protein ACFE0H_05000, partial [Elainellaceae cyanobacterium]
SAVAVSPDGETLVSGGADGMLRFWTLAGEPIGTPVVGYAAPTRSQAAAFPLWLLWLLPLAALALLIWWLLSQQSVTQPQGAVSDAAKPDGEQPRSMRKGFEQETPRRQTNTKDEAQDEWSGY